MDVFSCRVRPGGHIFHEVNKHGVTAAEVVLLRVIHGNTASGSDPVTGFVRTGVSNVSERAEYARLAEIYTPEKVREVYGPVTQARLPTTIDDEFEDAVLGAPTPAAKGKKGKAAKHAPVTHDDDDLDLNTDD